MRKIYMQFIYLLIITSIFSGLGCKKDELNTLSVSPDKVDLQKEGGTIILTIQTDADSWNISNLGAEWVSLSRASGTDKKALVTLKVTSKTIEARVDTLTITAGNALPVELIISQPSSEYIYSLTADCSSLEFLKAGRIDTISITTNAPQWNLSSNADWLQFSQITGNSGVTAVKVTALENTTDDFRSVNVTINATYAPQVQISVLQKSGLYPKYNSNPIAPDATGMSNDAVELASNIKLGWNIGNTLEATGGETAWGNPLVTKAFIAFVKQSGFNAIRIPCAWNQYMENSSTAKLKLDWLNRVKEVVQYCVENDMYVLLNIHWDGGWLENNCTVAKQEENNAKQKAFWEQIATHLRSFDEHLLFASANEPNVSNATEMAVLKSYHQTFIDAVRSTGGRNSYRVLVIQGPSTDIEKTNKLMLTLPTDPIANRMMVEIHYYTPWNFCGMTEDASWGKMFYYWGKNYHSATDTNHNPTWGEEDAVNSYFLLMKNQFVDKGIPVVMGEYGVTRRSALTGDALTLHLASRAYYLKYVTKQARANGILPFYWDNGGTGNNGCGLFYRNSNTVFDQQALDSLVQGAAK
jgi:endoglucanase